MANLYKKSFDDADEVKSPPKAHVEVVKLGNMNASRLVLQPGWRWSECIKPVVGGDSYSICDPYLALITHGPFK